MEQRTSDWLEWRRQGIGASDAPIIMKDSPWQTPFGLWLQKTKRYVPEETSNWAQERGNELEPIARAKFELETGIDMPAKLCRHIDFPWLKASLDGGNDTEKAGLEIKFLGSNDLKLAENGIVPPKYKAQIQHQLMVTGYEKIYFYGYSVPANAEKHCGTSVTIEVFPDLDYIKKLFLAEIEFWNNINYDVPPPFIKRDYKMLKVKGAKALAVEYLNILSSAEAINYRQRVEEIEEELFEMGKDLDRFWIGDLKSEIRNGMRVLEIADWGDNE